MKLRKCRECNIYTINEKCPKCKKKTFDAHYKFIRIKDVRVSLPSQADKDIA